MNTFDDANRLRDDLIATMNRGRSFVADLDPDDYAASHPELGLSSVGEHYRHHLDHIAAFVRSAKVGHIDYDDRRRDSRIAGDPARAIEATDRLIDALAALSLDGDLEELTVVHQTRSQQLERPVVSSEPSREFQFLISHAIHHYALMAIAARACGVSVPEELGMAPSTLEHQRRQSA